jgi:hypothetical protein
LSNSTRQSLAWPGSGAPVRRKNGGTGQVNTPGARAGEIVGTVAFTDVPVRSDGHDRRRPSAPISGRAHQRRELLNDSSYPPRRNNGAHRPPGRGKATVDDVQRQGHQYTYVLANPRHACPPVPGKASLSREMSAPGGSKRPYLRISLFSYFCSIAVPTACERKPRYRRPRRAGCRRPAQASGG